MEKWNREIDLTQLMDEALLKRITKGKEAVIMELLKIGSKKANKLIKTMKLIKVLNSRRRDRDIQFRFWSIYKKIKES